VNQKDCKSPYAEESGVNINIDETTFTAGSVANVVRKAGEKIGDGIEVVAEGAGNIYNRVSNSRRGSLVNENEDVKDAEWLP
jgi:apolipoprotein D and lipocalin family protein